MSDLENEKNLLLYLRPFSVDTLPLTVNPLVLIFFNHFTPYFWTWMKLMLQGHWRFENALKNAFRKMGKLVAISDPKMNMILTGADKVIYDEIEQSKTQTKWFNFSFQLIRKSKQTNKNLITEKFEDKWKTIVLNFIDKAKVVILHIGYSESMKWEYLNVLAKKNPEEIVLCVNVPQGGKLIGLPKNKEEFKLRLGLDRNQIQNAWIKFRKECGDLFPKPLPEDIGKSRLIRFDKNWNPYTIQPMKRRIIWFIPYGKPLPSRKTVEGAADWLSWLLIPESFSRRLARHIFNYFTLVIISLIMVFFFAKDI